MSAFKLLTRDLQKYIWDQQWPKLTNIQTAAIENIINTPNNFILVAKTASGKTEAAFLPTISLVTNWTESVKILYISPLIALINDQFVRVEKLCRDSQIKITKWHGEASLSTKKKLVAQPEGIMLITPESIEAMFVNHPEYLNRLFNGLAFVIIDEIHSFLGTDRGRHLQSLLSRLKAFNRSSARLIGLSATINPKTNLIAKNFYQNGQPTKIIRDKSQNSISQEVNYIPPTEAGQTNQLPVALIDALYHKTQASKSLIFPNSRGRVEEIAVRLTRRASKDRRAHNNYFAHHSSVDKDLREFIEGFAKSSRQTNFAISCTSTLELGIDIGSIDTVIQVDSTFSVASLVQRLGRSGRHQDQHSQLFLYATEKWELLQSVACIELYRSGCIEPIEATGPSYNVFLHQLLSVVSQYSGISATKLLNVLADNPIGENITQVDKQSIINHLLKQDILENVDGELIIGLAGEKITTGKSFYSLFETRIDYSVISNNKRIGQLPWSQILQEGQNLFLAAKVWQILTIDQQAKKIMVKPAPDGKKPSFYGNPGPIHQMVCDQMLAILQCDDSYDYLSQPAQAIINSLRRQLVAFRQNRLIVFGLGSAKQEWYTFAGTKTLKTILLVLKHHYNLKDVEGGDKSTRITKRGNKFNGLQSNEFRQSLHDLTENGLNQTKFTNLIKQLLKRPGNDLSENKFARFLPLEIRAKQILINNFDIESTNALIKDATFTWL